KQGQGGQVMSEILTHDSKMRELIQLAKTVAQSKATILIQGESGTGKELLAQLIHSSSSRSQRPLIAINCAAIPDNLLESELFGYERGAFTGAISSKAGKFELANGGTLLLDEVSELDMRLQAKLLRVIQEGVVDRVGGIRPIPVDVRIIAISNRSLSDCVRQGSFREDLFYRLNVVNLTIPALRERICDVEIISKKFIEMNSLKNGKNITGISQEALSFLQSHSWPGNVRELENVIERSVLTSVHQEIQLADIVIERTTSQFDLSLATDQSGDKSWTPGQTLDDIERSVIVEALQYHQGNRTHTAKALGISIRTLRNKIADYKRLGIHL
ncbi:sigma-54-dependent Fis family transcriptional regulator, partial [bacterium]|nr:sigma-54-dependent Fis family transcriptional regulator [bacterium]